MKRITWLAAALLMAVAGVAQAAPDGVADAGPSAGGISSDNVEFIKNIPISVDGVGGRLIGDYFYTNDQNKVMIFDVSDPLDPQMTGFVPMPQEVLYSREDLDGNGHILVVPNSVIPNPGESSGSGKLIGATYIVDVEDKTNPQIIAQLNGSAQHTMSCILRCKWAYGSDGNIIDLRDPAKPKLIEKKWGEGLPAQAGHDVNEVAPGLVLTSTQPMMLLDVHDPLNPKMLAKGFNLDGRFIHSNDWPRNAKDKFFLAGGETNNQVRCNERNGALMTWDASKWRKTETFTMIDEYRMVNGTYVDGSPAVNAVGCSSHWLEAHPDFHNGGLVAAAFFEHGTRFVDITPKGQIEEIGWFMPHGGSTGAAYWITDEIVYAVDYARGIDILRFTAE